jgi:hypothetical protein
MYIHILSSFCERSGRDKKVLKISPKRRKFAQSGHPEWGEKVQMKVSSRATRRVYGKIAQNVAQPN